VAALAAVLFAVGAVLQHEAASASGSGRGPDLRQLVTRPVWLVGQSATATGTLLQVVALGLAPVAIVQPLLAAGLVVALGLRAVRTRCIPTPAEVLGAVLTVGGLAVFLVAAKPRAGEPHRLPHPAAVIAIAVLAVLLVAVTARMKRGVAGALACGCAGGIAAGVAAVLISIALRILRTQGLVHMLSSSALWGAVGVAVVAQLGAQQAYARGSLSWSMPALVLLDPLAAIPAARFLLGERLEPGHAVVWLPAAAVAAVGVVLLSRSGEDCRRPFRIGRPADLPAARAARG
jgi:drug/metabolite transporter (DMT)-like permease